MLTAGHTHEATQAATMAVASEADAMAVTIASPQSLCNTTVWLQHTWDAVKACAARAAQIHWSVRVLVGVSAVSAAVYAWSPFVRRTLVLYR